MQETRILRLLSCPRGLLLYQVWLQLYKHTALPLPLRKIQRYAASHFRLGRSQGIGTTLLFDFPGTNSHVMSLTPCCLYGICLPLSLPPFLALPPSSSPLFCARSSFLALTQLPPSPTILSFPFPLPFLLPGLLPLPLPLVPLKLCWRNNILCLIHFCDQEKCMIYDDKWGYIRKEGFPVQNGSDCLLASTRKASW